MQRRRWSAAVLQIWQPALPPLTSILFRHLLVFASSLIAILLGCSRGRGWQLFLALAAVQTQAAGLDAVPLVFSVFVQIAGHFGHRSLRRLAMKLVSAPLHGVILLLNQPPPLCLWRAASLRSENSGVTLFTSSRAPPKGQNRHQRLDQWFSKWSEVQGPTGRVPWSKAKRPTLENIIHTVVEITTRQYPRYLFIRYWVPIVIKGLKTPSVHHNDILSYFFFTPKCQNIYFYLVLALFGCLIRNFIRSCYIHSLYREHILHNSPRTWISCLESHMALSYEHSVSKLCLVASDHFNTKSKKTACFAWSFKPGVFPQGYITQFCKPINWPSSIPWTCRVFFFVPSAYPTVLLRLNGSHPNLRSNQLFICHVNWLTGWWASSPWPIAGWMLCAYIPLYEECLFIFTPPSGMSPAVNSEHLKSESWGRSVPHDIMAYVVQVILV